MSVQDAALRRNDWQTPPWHAPPWQLCPQDPQLLGSLKGLPQPPLLEDDVLEDEALEAALLEADTLEAEVLDDDVLEAEDDAPPLPASHWHGIRWVPSEAHTCTPAAAPGQAQPTCAPGTQKGAVEVPPPEVAPAAASSTEPPPQPGAADHANAKPATTTPIALVRTRTRYHGARSARAVTPNRGIGRCCEAPREASRGRHLNTVAHPT